MAMNTIRTEKEMLQAALDCLIDAEGQGILVDENKLTSEPVACVLKYETVQLYKLPATTVGNDRQSTTGCNLFFNEDMAVMNTRKLMFPVGSWQAGEDRLMGEEGYFVRLIACVIMWIAERKKAMAIYLDLPDS